MAGDFNGQWGLNPAHAPISVAYSVGATYTTGPIIAGVQAFHYNSTGNSYQGNASVGQMTENGLSVGATYSLAPGLSVFLDYLYGTRKENGYDLLNSVAGSRNNNYVQSQLIGVGTQLRW
jgi:predicted porin